MSTAADSRGDSDAAAEPERYGAVAMALHWVIAGLIAAQFVLAERAEDLPLGMAKLQLIANHKSIGITILALAILRLGWRLWASPPSLPASVPGWQRRVSAFTHGAIYGLIFAIPLSGWAFSSAANFPVSWFNLVELPNLVAPDEARSELLENLHEWLGKALLALVIVHVAAALKHQFLDRDGVLLRMLPWPRRTASRSAADS